VRKLAEVKWRSLDGAFAKKRCYINEYDIHIHKWTQAIAHTHRASTASLGLKGNE